MIGYSSRCVRVAWMTLTVVAASLTAATAQDFPNRPIQVITPYAAGGATDQIARLLQQGLAERLGQPIIVVNRPGGGTTIGTQSVARSAPDGHTVGIVSVPYTSNFTLMKEMPYTHRDFIPITSLTNTPSVLVVTPSFPVNNLAELIAYVKARPGEINYATFGVGSSPHLATLQFESLIGAKLVHVPYKGGAPAALAVMTGEVHMAFGTPLSVAGGIQSGKLKPIAVASEKRIGIFADVPTFIESGLSYKNGAWFGALAPAGTPQPIVQRLYETIRDSLNQPDVKQTIEKSGTDIFILPPAEFARFIEEDTKLWARILGSLQIEKL